MPIVKHSRNYETGVITSETLLRGRVLKVEKTTETRNWSDTMDYTDYRSTNCTWALVYIGTHGVAPREHFGRTITFAETSSWDKPRDLTAGERFAWVDCTNLFGDRNGFNLAATEDAFSDILLHSGPEIYEHLKAWEAHHKAIAEQRQAEAARQAEVRAAAEKLKATRAAEKQTKDAVLKAAAEGHLARIPAKGTVVTVDGFTGKVFWTGVSKYRGTWSARAGVKDSRGNVQWVSADRFA